jgi:hypothetical protein
MGHEVTDAGLLLNTKKMSDLDMLYSVSYSNRHLQRRSSLRTFIKRYPTDYALLGETCMDKLLELCDPENLDPDRHRLTSFISAVAPRMANIKGCTAGSKRDKSGEYGYTNNHALRNFLCLLVQGGYEA